MPYAIGPFADINTGLSIEPFFFGGYGLAFVLNFQG